MNSRRNPKSQAKLVADLADSAKRIFDRAIEENQAGRENLDKNIKRLSRHISENSITVHIRKGGANA